MLQVIVEQKEPSLPSVCDIFSMTSSQWVEHAMLLTGGKGSFQAYELYRACMKKGFGFENKKTFLFSEDMRSQISAFLNAEYLWGLMTKSISSSSMLELILRKTDTNTTKLLFRTHDGYEVESVVIPMKNKATLCISSQVGCRMGCRFCETGRMGLLRNLSASEIVQQVYLTLYQSQIPIHNIVFMGMGEPFDNYNEVLQASRVLMDMNGLGFGRKNITISTSGRVAEIQKFTLDSLQAPMPNLAVSLNGGTDELRTQLMPHNRKEPLNMIFTSVLEYIQRTKREVLFAYVLLQGVNDTIEHADEVVSFLLPLKNHIRLNVIPYNPQSHDRFQPPQESVIDRFIERIRVQGIRVLIRKTKGRSIMAGCGQLGNLSLRRKSIARE